MNRKFTHMIPLQVVSTILFALLFSTCDQPNGPGKYPFLELTAENVISKEVWLRVRFVNTAGPLDFVLERNGSQIAVGKIQTAGKADTLVIDTAVSPGTTYRYKAIQLEGTARTMESDVVEVTTLDTTSHAVQWQVDTLGVRGEIYDVWAFSRDNIWAVGEIFLKDSTGKEDPVLYNLAKWDGQNWTPQRAVLATTNCIFAFAPNDVWIGTGTPYHWDGQSWKAYSYPGEGFYIRRLWGTSSSNLFGVGSKGSIIRFNGTAWQRMDSGTDVDLEDVWGIDATHVWATGTNIDDGRCVILQYDGRNWKTIYDNSDIPPDLRLYFSTVWTNSSNVIYLAGASNLRSLNVGEMIFRRIENPGQWYTYRLRGTNQNDLFETGQGSEVVHYGGGSAHLYEEVETLASGHSHWFSVHVTKDLVIVGGYFFTGLYGVPVVLRGVR
jgi:hypothetical protein